jgi:hypothetical protein
MDQIEKGKHPIPKSNYKKALQMWRDTTDPEKNTRAEQSRGGKQRQTKSLYLKQQNSKCNNTKDQNEVSRVCTQFCALGGRQIWQRMLYLGSVGGYRCACLRQMLGSHVHTPSLSSLASRAFAMPLFSKELKKGGRNTDSGRIRIWVHGISSLLSSYS